MSIGKHKIDEVDVAASANRIRIAWRASIGFGRYDLERNDDGQWIGHSEYMDQGEDKDFLKTLLLAFADEVKVER